MDELIAGGTRRFSWVNSGVTPSAILFNVYDGSETMVHSSAAAVSSGNGHYYYDYTVPGSGGLYAYQWTATISAVPWINKGFFKTKLFEVD